MKFDCEPQSRTSIKIETIPACIMEKDVNYVKSMREAVAWNIVQVFLVTTTFSPKLLIDKRGY